LALHRAGFPHRERTIQSGEMSILQQEVCVVFDAMDIRRSEPSAVCRIIREPC